MLFNKSIISFVAAIALASSVAAAATGQQGTDPNQAKTDNSAANPAQNNAATATGPPVCSSGTPTCCDSEQPFSSLSSAFQDALKALDPNLNTGLSVGVNCNAAGSQTCPTLGLCCDAIQNQDGLPNVAPNCVAP